MKKNEKLKLFKDFFLFGCFTFGGGWSIVAQAEKKYCEEEKLMSEADLMDVASLGKCFPGMMICNFAMLFGYRRKGFWGGMACLTGLIIMPFVIIAILFKGYDAVQDVEIVKAAMMGVRAVVVPIIIYAIRALMTGSMKTVYGVLIALAAFVMQVYLGVDIVLLVVFGIVCGLVIGAVQKRRGKNNAAD